MNKFDTIPASTLEVFNIGKKYKNRPVLRNVSLNVKRGEAVGLLGPNGAGKTTCFYCVTGLITPDYGDVHIDGHDITNLPMYRRARMGIGYLPQEASIFRALTVEENIKAILEIGIDVHAVGSFALNFHVSLMERGFDRTVIHNLFNVADTFC